MWWYLVFLFSCFADIIPCFRNHWFLLRRTETIWPTSLALTVSWNVSNKGFRLWNEAVALVVDSEELESTNLSSGYVSMRNTARPQSDTSGKHCSRLYSLVIMTSKDMIPLRIEEKMVLEDACCSSNSSFSFDLAPMKRNRSRMSYPRPLVGNKKIWIFTQNSSVILFLLCSNFETWNRTRITNSFKNKWWKKPNSIVW